MSIKKIWSIVRKSVKTLKSSQPLILGSATAFFTLFSLAPIIIITINVMSLYFKREMVSEKLYTKLATLFGQDTAVQFQSIADNFREQASSVWITIGGSIFLAFVSTTLFHVIRSAINQIWSVKIRPASRIGHNLRQRSEALVIIFVGGLLFAVSLFADTFITVLNNYMDRLVPSVDLALIKVVSFIVSLITVSLWFAILFKYLPDARLRGKDAIVGGLFTGVLFSIGKYILAKVLITDNLNNIFGASASVMLVLLFIFYSSIIMYFGAAFTKNWACECGSDITPKKNAEFYTIQSLKE